MFLAGEKRSAQRVKRDYNKLKDLIKPAMKPKQS